MSSESRLPGPIRTVTERYHARPDAEMHALGLLWAALLVILVIPLLPFIAIVWLVNRLFGSSRTRAGERDRPRGGRRPA